MSHHPPNAELPTRRRHLLSARLLMLGMIGGLSALMLSLNPACAAGNQNAPDAAASLRIAFREAAREAKISDALDPAYELLGIAGSAQQYSLPQIAADAATAFADLVKRATAKALKTGGSATEDTLDQFVDLRFMARTANLPLPQAALDDAMTSLFPLVSAATQQKIDTAATWAEKLRCAGDLADQQASATQILKDDLARDIGAAFDQKTAQLETLAAAEADPAERARMLEGLAKTRQSRDVRIVDANANNMNVVAALMQNQGGAVTEGGTRAPSEVDVPEELAAGTQSCIETGFTGKQDPVLLRSLQVTCINSGRLPAQDRCPTSNLAFLCYGAAPGTERMTYVYRSTPEELYFQHKCGADKLVKADQVPAAGAAFRGSNVSLGFTCAPPAGQ